METFLLDEFIGTEILYHTDPHTGEAVIEKRTNIEPILADNYELRRDETPHGKDGLGRLEARVPPIIYWDLVKKGITRNQRELKRWLNDPANKVFRTSTGRV